MRSHAKAATAGSTTRRASRFALRLCAFAAALALLAVAAAPASAEAPPFLWQSGETGSGAGQTESPRGIAADPSNGHVFVADNFNSRIDEFTALGGFVTAWGWDVVEAGPDNTGSGFEICIPADGDTCKAGTEGSGTGQFNGTLGIALDSAGDVYLVDRNNRRVQKFDPEGHFVLMFGGKVNKTKVEAAAPEAEQNLCTAASGDICQAGVEGTGEGQFGEWAVGSFIAIDSADHVYVGDQNRIQRFDTAGHYVENLPDPESLLAGRTVQSLAADAKTGNLYASFSTADVLELDPAGNEVCTMEVKRPSAIAADGQGKVWVVSERVGGTPVIPMEIVQFNAAGCGEVGRFNAEAEGLTDSTGLATNLCPGGEVPGDLYVTNASSSEAFIRAYGTPPSTCGKAITGAASNIAETSARLNGKANPKGEAVTGCFFEYGTTITYGHTAPCAESPGEIGVGTTPVAVHADIGSLTKGTVYHFHLVIDSASGTEEGTDATFKTLGPPVISNDLAESVAYTEASLKALVNPEGFPSTYRFEYGTDASYGHSTPVQSAGSDRNNHTAQANLAGLAPGTTYHWRIVATNSSGETEGEDHTFTTYLLTSPETDCPNQALRTGPSAQLPDCRAYEMVSPVDKNGGDIVNEENGIGEHEAYIQASTDGERITYTAAPSFGDEPSSFQYNQYIAARQEGEGWSNHGINAPAGTPPPGFYGLALYYQAFSADLCSGWLLVQNATPLPAPGGQEGFNNYYRRDLCGEGGLEAVTTAAPPPGTDPGYVKGLGRGVQGTSADSRHVLFAAEAALTPEAAAGERPQLYDRFGGALHLVSVLPGGVPNTEKNAEVGSGRLNNLEHAVSADGSRVYWASYNTSEGPGKIYLRTHPEQGIVPGECSEAAKACTLAVSSGINALFWTAAADGSKALYSEGDLNAGNATLYRFDAASATRTPLAEGIKGVLGASEDLARIYLVSTEDLTPGQENGIGEEAEAGKPNLYLDEEGAFTFIGTLIEGDVAGSASPVGYQAPDLTSQEPRLRATRVSPDGRRLAFESRAQLTGFDNADANNGKADFEVFAYQAGGALDCVSCNPSGARAAGRELPPVYAYPSSIFLDDRTRVWAAAWIPTWQHSLYASRVLSDNGGRLFFHSYDALVPRDTNNVMDVYEWEAPGEGSCNEASPSFHAANGGCIYLISSGESPEESEFWDASADGRDVFFTTSSSLVPQDPGSVDLYDARAGGGIPQPTEKAACEGEACQSPPGAPNSATPASAAYRGAGNLSEAAKRCAKGKRKVRRAGKARCVKRHAKQHKHKSKNRQHKRRANNDRRAHR